MELQLTVNDNFFAELTQRLWKNSSDVVRELVQNAYDADASKVIVTFLPNGLIVEDDGGMDPARLRSFLQVGGTHEDVEFTARGRRVVGKYRVGRLSALGAFSRMLVRTRLDDYHVSFEFSVEDLHRLSQGTVNIDDRGRAPLKRNGTEISLVEQTAETKFDEVMTALVQQPILRTPGFEVYVRRASEFEEWNLEGAERVLPRDIPGIKLEVNIVGPLAITGLVTIAADSALPLSEEDRGIGIVTSSHLVERSLFGYENSPYRFDRVTGYVECIPPGTIVAGHYKSIDQYVVGEKCLGQNGRAGITATFSRHYSGQLVAVKGEGVLRTATTPEHPILVVTRKYRTTKRGRRIMPLTEPRWKPAKDLIPVRGAKGGDYLVIPRTSGWIKSNEIDLQQFTNSHGRRTALGMGAPLKLPLNKETAWLLGLYVAEGSCGKDRLYFSLGKHERVMETKIGEIAGRLGYKTYTSETRTEINVTLFSNLLARGLSEWCGRGASNKRIPDFILYHVDDGLLRAFWDGYMAGDGYVNSRRRQPEQVANTTSRVLALQFQLLAARLGRFVKLYYKAVHPNAIIEGRTVRQQNQYYLACAMNAAARKQFVVTEQHILVPVKEVSADTYDGPVYNLETSDSSYLANNIIVHNCNQLKTTFGAKDRVVEDQTYRLFHEQMRQFLSRKVVPALKDAELRHIGKLEVKTLRHVDRILGEALVKVASDMLPSQPLSPEAMKALAPTVIKRTKESTVLLIPQGATGASPLPGSGADKEVVVSEVGGAQEIIERSENARPDGERRVGHYLHDVGIAVFIYEDKNDSRPSYNDPSFVIQGVRVKAVFVNKLHPSYARCERTGGLVNHLVTLIAHELVAISDQNNVPAVQLINKIYGTALA